MCRLAMCRFVQYPFDKTKMAEVREWVNGSDLKNVVRGQPGVKDVEFSFCPGEGWLAARYIFVRRVRCARRPSPLCDRTRSFSSAGRSP